MKLKVVERFKFKNSPKKYNIGEIIEVADAGRVELMLREKVCVVIEENNQETASSDPNLSAENPADPEEGVTAREQIEEEKPAGINPETNPEESGTTQEQIEEKTEKLVKVGNREYPLAEVKTGLSKIGVRISGNAGVPSVSRLIAELTEEQLAGLNRALAIEE